MLKKILLNQTKYVEAGTSDTTIPISLPCDKELIVDDNFTETINEYGVYLDEREACNTIRLSARVNLLASNVIFNSVTEIVKDEGSDSCICLNYEPREIESTLCTEPDYEWGTDITYAVMNTELTSDIYSDKNYDYLCGIDILDNHILRSKSKFATSLVNKSDLVDESIDWYGFNTLNEYLTDANGWARSLVSTIFAYNDKPEHKYNTKNTMSFFESLMNNLLDRGGWIGFLNKTQMKWASLGINNVINNKDPQSFIDLFPGRDRYSLLPHYNEHRKRMEKNWECCLTYPYSSTTSGIPFINERLNTLKILFIDENTNEDDGVYRCVVYTVSKHGLNVDDEINIYRSTEDSSKSELIEGNLVVYSVIDEYTFVTYTSDFICKNWVSVFDSDVLSTYSGVKIIGNKYQITHDGNTYIEYSSNDYLNLDYDEVENSQITHIGSKNLSFTKVVGDMECQYYVRIFSRFPNFDFYDKEVNTENIYSYDDSLGCAPVEEYSKQEYEKQHTFSKLAFSKNIYSDNISQIVFNDDIDISFLQDNLGRPLTSLYLSFFKTNYGYREWYEKDENNNNIPDYKSPEVEWSRCFGKLNCGFEFSPYINSIGNNSNNSKNTAFYGNVFTMHNINNQSIDGRIETINGGLNQNILGGGRNARTSYQNAEYDEIFYRSQDKFYGDLCCYSPYECLETSIQFSYNRFNTAQRELSGKSFFYSTPFKAVVAHDVVDAPNAANITESYVYDNYPTSHPEGNYYKPHYEIPIRSFSTNVIEYRPVLMSIVEISDDDEYDTYGENYVTWILKTAASNYIDMDANVCIFDNIDKVEYKCEVIGILDVNVLKVKIYGLNTSPSDVNPLRYKIYRKNENIPSYAFLVPGNNLVYRWRSVIQNGFEESEGIVPEYPFVNGCLYVHRDINIFLKRQDPFGIYGLATQTPYYGLPLLSGKPNPVEDGTADNISDAFREEYIRC